MGVVCEDTHVPVATRILHEISSDRGRGGERFSSKIRNSRNGKIDLPCFSVRGRTGSGGSRADWATAGGPHPYAGTKG